ncbi:aromatic amino acid lyase [Paraburkholderia sp. NMBU_R16]|uniref:HAL/PAL/TAL family ammonia-lyase n=1 Tax=Paraburkholderia sp. NMBU_R16 TaxID=2698676 RepID=UPI001562FFDF|nr:aromatic amino acid ammonia-lyase [Paraburkholderia sp. NMBU_R16]NRO99412.1 aromatic amino acid lyase [Paraburkholderia sp. NMBU_R16]
MSHSDLAFADKPRIINAEQPVNLRRDIPFVITLNRTVSLEDIWDVAVHRRLVQIAPEVVELLERGRAALQQKLEGHAVIYGVNTGFGGNSDLVISSDKLASHQANLLTFLAAGTGERFPEDYVRAAQLLTLLALARGWSAVRSEVAMTLLGHLNHGIVPDVPRHGSVGASGDLIPSSYIAAALCGRGAVRYAGTEMAAAEALGHAGLPALELRAKEGLALVNGTRVMTAISALTVQRFRNTLRSALGALALAVEAIQASHEHFDARIHAVKGHAGQITVASVLRSMLAGSTLSGHRARRSDPHVGTSLDTGASPEARKETAIQVEEGAQEVYSIRCAPQVLGVVVESLDQVRAVLEREAVSANDNPLIDPETGDVLHGGNFMGQHVSRAMDGLKIDIATVGNHLHAIMALLMDSRFSRGLPNSLSPRLGIYQGFKGMQISQTALVAHLRRESAPASVHTLATEQFNQDIVSLGLHAALGAAEMETQLRDVAAMTLLAACQAVDLRGNVQALASRTAELFDAVRALSPMLEADRQMDQEIAAVSRAIAEDRLPLPQWN